MFSIKFSHIYRYRTQCFPRITDTSSFLSILRKYLVLGAGGAWEFGRRLKTTLFSWHFPMPPPVSRDGSHRGALPTHPPHPPSLLPASYSFQSRRCGPWRGGRGGLQHCFAEDNRCSCVLSSTTWPRPWEWPEELWAKVHVDFLRICFGACIW